METPRQIAERIVNGENTALVDANRAFWVDRITQSISVAVGNERERCTAEILHVQKRNTETDNGLPNTWNRAVETMASECIDSINSTVDG